MLWEKYLGIFQIINVVYLIFLLISKNVGAYYYLSKTKELQYLWSILSFLLTLFKTTHRGCDLLHWNCYISLVFQQIIPLNYRLLNLLQLYKTIILIIFFIKLSILVLFPFDNVTWPPSRNGLSYKLNTLHKKSACSKFQTIIFICC